MRFLKFLFLIYLGFPFVDAICPKTNCGDWFLPIHYPFKLQGQNPKICSNYTDLRCDPQNNKTIINLPFSGDFYVHDILYFTNEIILSDPQDCLLQRLMNLNLSSSPFSAVRYENYTFYNCPITNHLITDGFQWLVCLSNPPNATVATSSVSPEDMMKIFGCTGNVTVEIPVQYGHEFDYSGASRNQFRLKWDVPACDDCHETDKHRRKFIGSTGFIILVIVLGTFLVGSCFACFILVRVARRKATRTAATTAAAAATTEEAATTPHTTTTAAVSPPRTTTTTDVSPPAKL